MERALWLLHLLQQLEDSKDTSEVAAEIESYLLDSYSPHPGAPRVGG